MADDLFTPTIAPAAYEVRRPPWRPQSLFFPAVLGGPTAVTVLALVNSGRLGLPRRATLTVLGAGVAGLVARVVVTLSAGAAGTERPGRWIGALAGGLVWLAVSATQKGRYRAYELRGGEPASLWGPGIAAVLVLGFAEAALLLLLAAA
ncbi:hypothetical protein NCC78_19835 [Micromonospora phytophila]|uniref:hypothetical protein n=1 Tax=Micromonospora phytophila TaxID=709888 RepID=UPI00202DF6CA|nr:hypothetical protein [Micromonospora phytophila]MCM0676921.1 hypothetical protein [Micromonospora phytophila]